MQMYAQKFNLQQKVNIFFKIWRPPGGTTAGDAHEYILAADFSAVKFQKCRPGHHTGDRHFAQANGPLLDNLQSLPAAFNLKIQRFAEKNCL